MENSELCLHARNHFPTLAACTVIAEAPFFPFFYSRGEVGAGHVMLNRVDSRSQLQVLTTCRELLSEGCSVLFFPEGTRSNDGKLHDFKKVRKATLLASSPVAPLFRS